MPDGIRWNFHLTPSRTIVWPALLPPWKRITRSACSAKRSVILPLPSSPHWAPTITIPAIAVVQSSWRFSWPAGPRSAVEGALVVAPHGQRLAAHLVQPRDGAGADLRLERVVREVRGQQHRLPVLVAGVDDAV